MGIIYRIRHKESGRLYIGQTIYGTKRRFTQHVNYAYEENAHCYNSHLQKAIRKYGAEAFEIEVVEQCDNELLDERERYWIAYYDTVNTGFNVALGGSGTPRYNSQDVLEAWNSGMNVGAIAQKLGMSDRTVSVHLRNMGITKDDTRKRAYESIKEKVYKYDLDGNYLGEYPSSADAQKELGKGGIQQAIDNPERSFCGFLWSKHKAEHVHPYCGFTNKKQVHQYTEDGQYVATYNSVAEASKALGINHTGIVNACNGSSRWSHGYRWSYDKVDKLPELKRKRIKRRKNNERIY